MSANQRLKGLLSGKSSSFDKPMSIPTGTGLPPPIPPSADKPQPPAPASTTTANNAHDQHQNMDRDHFTNESQVSLGLSPSPPIQKPTGLPEGAGFKQVELSSSNSRLQETPHAKDK